MNKRNRNGKFQNFKWRLSQNIVWSSVILLQHIVDMDVKKSLRYKLGYKSFVLNSYS